MLFLILKLYYQLNSHVCIYLHTSQFQDCVMLHSCMSLHSLMVVLERILCFQVCHFIDNPFTPATHLPSFLFRIVLIFLYIYSFKGSGFSVCQSSHLFIRFSFIFKERFVTISMCLSKNVFIYLGLVLYSSIHLKNFVWGCRLLNLFMGIYFAINRIFFLLYLLIRFFSSG